MNIMKYIKYLLPIVAAGCLLAYAADEPKDIKLLPKHPVAPPAAQNAPVPVPLRLEGAEDGIPYGLHAVSVDEKAVTLQWNNPEPMEGYFDDFEGHSDFVINSPGSIGWDYLDLDNANTYTWAAASFPNQGQKMAFIIMNPSKTAPSTADWPAIKPFSGSKMLAAFCASAPNNDYIISPELSFTEDFQISFQAKTYSDRDGKERVRVGYSTTGKNPTDFKFVSQSPYEEIPVDWTLMKYDIPKEAKYVTINCVSDDAFMLLIDDLFIGTNKVRPMTKSFEKRVMGFNLYRDGNKVNEERIGEVIYTDNVPDYGTYQYKVSCVYSDNSESEQSVVLEVKVPDTRLLPFEDDFSNWTLDLNKWNTPADDKGNDNNWKIDYYTYGLVDPAATYSYSRLENYSQSLVTRELRTSDPDNTYLRFEIRHLNYKSLDGDTLSVELSFDDTNWTEIKSFLNKEGTYGWRVEQFSLNDFLKGEEMFRLRFRAHGIEAFNIDYWYVDDIKVWNPQWTSARLSVKSQGTSVPGCPVTLTAGHGAVIQATTDANGVVDLPQIEKGEYEVYIVREDCNTYKATWNIEEDADCRFTATLTQPVLKLDHPEVTLSLKAEEKVSRYVTLKNEGDGVMTWNLFPSYEAGSGDNAHAWDVQRSFNASTDLQSAIAFDGENYYAASWYYMGKYFKYDKEGNFIEEFSVPDMYYKINDLAFDGKYFYGSDDSNRLFVLDLRNKRLVKEIIIAEEPGLKITHCCYDSRNDQFWVGGYNTIGRIDREGNVKVNFRNISGETDISSFGSAFDNITPGGPYLWFGNQVTSGNNSIDKTQIIQYAINTRKIVSTHSLTDIPGYKVGNTYSGPNYVTGIEATTLVEDGTLTLLGVLQQSPARIFAYKLCDVDTWLSFSPKGGVLEPGTEQKVAFGIDARNGVVGQTYTTGLQLNSLPGTEVRTVNVSYTVDGVSETPRPVKLTAELEGNTNVKLTWKAGDSDKKPMGYNVYRNGKKVTGTLISTTEYVDKNLLHGNYSYTVTAIYSDEKESVYSDEAVVAMKFGAPYYSPVGLSSSVEQNRKVQLSWQLPDEKTKSPVTLQWDDGVNADALGMGEGGFFWAGTFWDYDDVIDYRGMMLDEVKVFIKERCLALSLKLYKDDTCIQTQVVDNSDIRYGEYTTVTLKNPIRIEAGYSYKVTFLIVHDMGVRPIGIDGTTPVEGKGNIVSMDGKEWYPASYLGMDTGNFNISVHLSPTDEPGELAPAGYNIYRNGVRVNNTLVAERKYVDEVEQPGTYSYQVSAVYEGGGESGLGDATQAEIIKIGTPYAPSLLRTEVELNRTIRLRWNYPLQTESSFPIDMTRMPVTCLENHPEFVYTFSGKYPGEMAIASDGEFIYTSMFKSNGTINKYSLGGDFIESFCVNNKMQGIRNLAYDGKDFYASDCTSFIYKVDMKNKVLSDTLTISEIARHLAYIPDLDEGRGGFEVGDWETGIYVSMKGAKLGGNYVYKGAAGTAYYNGTLYAFEQGYENACTICMYDSETGIKKGCVDLKDYVEINPEPGTSAGGMTVIETKEGLHLLGLALQGPSNTRFIFLDLDGLKGVEGYNIYCNGEKLNEAPLHFRYYQEIRDVAGEYRYEVETVYIDGTTSPRSKSATVEIIESGDCDAPVQVKARQSTYPYNVIISFVNPSAASADLYESVETGTTGETFEHAGWQNLNGAWKVTEEDAYEGGKALIAEKGQVSLLILPINRDGNAGVFSFVARNSDDHNGNGVMQILSSVNSDQLDDFSLLAVVNTTEEWKQYVYQLPAGIKYIAIRQDANAVPVLMDAISLNERAIDDIYGYDIYRDGRKLNEKVVTDVSFTDHNLLPGSYEYQVKAHYTTSCESDFSDKAAIDVSYSNNCQKPGPLSAEGTDEGILLKWSAPSLGDAVNLKWHSGTSHGSAGMPSGGSYFAGVQWSGEELQPYAHMSLSEVEVYINQVPDALFLLVYEGNNIVYQQYVPDLRQRSFNTIVLDNPLPINADKFLRVAIYVEHNEITVPLGYDEGPAKGGKGDLYSPDGVSWETLGDNEIYGNWNITLGLRAYAPTMNRVANENKQVKTFAPKPATGDTLQAIHLKQSVTSTVNTFDGYNLYCNSELVNDEPLHTVSYIDRNSYNGKYLEYQVTAIYSECGEVGSNKVRMMSTGVNEYALEQTIYIHTENTCIVIEGIQADMKVSLLDTHGKIIFAGIAGNEEVYRINTAAMAEGVYLVKVDNMIKKVVVTK